VGKRLVAHSTPRMGRREEMSFVAKFYHFTIDLSHTEREFGGRIRVKVPLHPMESLHHFYARMIAFLNEYCQDLEFTQGLFDPKLPTAWHREITGEVRRWIQVGVPDKKKLEMALRCGVDATYHVYFYASEQIEHFCHHLRGSKTNWVAPFTFYLIDPSLLEALVPLERSSPEWTATFIDSHLYLTVDDQELDAPLIEIDIWRAYQDTLASVV
jgi:uncharacterized protein YaeQ